MGSNDNQYNGGTPENDEHFLRFQIHKQISENPDSIEIGTPSKGGAIKVYGDFNKPDEFIEKIKNARAVQLSAQQILGGSP